MTTIKDISAELAALDRRLSELEAEALSNMEKRQLGAAREIAKLAEAAIRHTLAPALRGTEGFAYWSRPGGFDCAAAAARTLAPIRLAHWPAGSNLASLIEGERTRS